MTTEVIIAHKLSHPDVIVRVQATSPTGHVNLTDDIAPGESKTFYVHSHQSLMVTEIVVLKSNG
jgi:hypothetical protein